MPVYRLGAYFGLVAALTLPFWVLGAFVDVMLLPGLPIAALAVVCPSLAGAILIAHDGGASRLIAWLKEAASVRHAGRWLAVALVINPILFALAFVISRALGAQIPDAALALDRAAGLFAFFLLGALLEELGWSGYALSGLQQRVGATGAALILGAFWALWHIPALVQAGRSLEWIGWWCLWTLSARVIMVWLYNWAGAGVLAVALYHAASNLCWQLYPVSGSYFDPQISGLITLVLASAIVLSQRRRSRSRSRSE